MVPIPGTTKLERLIENIGAAAVELTSDDLLQIESAASKITVQGARYPQQLERMTGLLAVVCIAALIIHVRQGCRRVSVLRRFVLERMFDRSLTKQMRLPAKPPGSSGLEPGGYS